MGDDMTIEDIRSAYSDQIRVNEWANKQRFEITEHCDLRLEPGPKGLECYVSDSWYMREATDEQLTALADALHHLVRYRKGEEPRPVPVQAVVETDNAGNQ